MKRLLTYLLPVLFLGSACGGEGQKGESAESGKDTAKSENQEANQEQSDEENDGEENQVELEFPKPSPQGKVMQTIGITDAKIHYYRPSVKDRQIWGDLVPYDEMWRTGANKNTTFHFSNDVMVNGNKVPEGKYSFFTIPKKDGKWTLIFNEKTDHWGTRGYDKSNDALRIKVDPKKSDHHHEMMTFNFKDVTDNSAKVILAWKKTMVPFMVKTNTSDHVMAKINKAIDQAGSDDWKVYNESADYLVENGKKLDKAKEWVNESIDIKENWRNLWTKSQLMKQKGDMQKSLEIAKKALKVGKENDMREYYVDYMKENIEELKSAMDS